MRVLLSTQVDSFRRKLHPEQRRAMKQALIALQKGRGDCLPLEDELEGYYRLRFGENRIVFRYADSGDVYCVFAERRKLIYDLLRANPEWLLGD